MEVTGVNDLISLNFISLFVKWEQERDLPSGRRVN